MVRVGLMMVEGSIVVETSERGEYCTIGLLDSAIVIVKFSSEEIEPLFEVEDSIIHEITGSCLDQEGLLVGKIFCETRGNDTALLCRGGGSVLAAGRAIGVGQANG